jgi:DNA-directed RNA polymerase subunit RPC12/RpoP
MNAMVMVMVIEQDKEYVCQSCDEAFFYFCSGEEEIVCPRCGARGVQWILPVSELKSDDDQFEKTAP